MECVDDVVPDVKKCKVKIPAKNTTCPVPTPTPSPPSCIGPNCPCIGEDCPCVGPHCSCVGPCCPDSCVYYGNCSCYYYNNCTAYTLGFLPPPADPCVFFGNCTCFPDCPCEVLGTCCSPVAPPSPPSSPSISTITIITIPPNCFDSGTCLPNCTLYGNCSCEHEICNPCNDLNLCPPITTCLIEGNCPCAATDSCTCEDLGTCSTTTPSITSTSYNPPTNCFEDGLCLPNCTLTNNCTCTQEGRYCDPCADFGLCPIIPTCVYF